MTEKLDHIKALCKVQKVLKHASKSEKGAFGKYADLATVYETIRKPLTEQGFAYFHSMVTDQGGSEFVETLLMHETGGTFKTRLPVINKKGDMQGLGSAITYAKRYGISMIVGLAHEDDDNGKGAGTGNVNPSGKTKKISSIKIKTLGKEGKANSVESAVMILNNGLLNIIDKGSNLKSEAEFIRKENAELLDQIKNNKAFIHNGINEQFNQIEQKLKEMENAKDE